MLISTPVIWGRLQRSDDTQPVSNSFSFHVTLGFFVRSVTSLHITIL